MAPKSSLRKIILINIASVCALLILAEAAIRLLGPEIPKIGTDRTLIMDDVYGASPGLRKNSSGFSNGAYYEVGQYGFWKYSSEMDPDKPSWLFLGDSATMGIGVDPDSTFAGRIAAQLDTVNVLNPSLIGYAVDDYDRVLEALIGIPEDDGKTRFNIKRITLFWCLNDIYPSQMADSDPGNQIRLIGGSALRFIQRHYATYQLLKAVIFDRPKSYFEFVVRFYRDEQEIFGSSISKLRQMSQRAETAGVKFEIVILPYEYQLRKSVTPEHLLPQEMLLKNLDNSGVDVYDPSDFLRFSDISHTELYLYGDGIHFSSIGHSLLSEFVSARLIH